TPEYMGVGYIIGPRIAGVLVAGGVLAWLGIIPLLASLVPPSAIALQLSKLGYLADVAKPGAFGWNPEAQAFVNLNRAIYFAYVRQIGAGAVAAGGFITLIRTIPTIVSAFRGSIASLRDKAGGVATRRTDQDRRGGQPVARFHLGCSSLHSRRRAGQNRHRLHDRGVRVFLRDGFIAH